MAEFLARYSMREKAIVAAALLVAVLLLLHALVIEPYQQRVGDLRERIAQQRSDLEWMRSAVARLPAPGSGSGTAAVEISGTLAAFVDQQVKRQQLTEQLAQMSPVGSDEIRMRYSAVDFNRLIRFIAEVNSSGLEIKDLRISSGDNPGIVDSSIVLVRR